LKEEKIKEEKIKFKFCFAQNCIIFEMISSYPIIILHISLTICSNHIISLKVASDKLKT